MSGPYGWKVLRERKPIDKHLPSSVPGRNLDKYHSAPPFETFNNFMIAQIVTAVTV